MNVDPNLEENNENQYKENSDVHYDDVEEGLLGKDFLRPEIAFRRKVYGIISMQLIFTAGLSACSMYIDSYA